MLMTDWRLTDPAHPRLVGTILLSIRVLVIGVLSEGSSGVEAFARDEKKRTMLGTCCGKMLPSGCRPTYCCRIWVVSLNALHWTKDGHSWVHRRQGRGSQRKKTAVQSSRPTHAAAAVVFLSSCTLQLHVRYSCMMIRPFCPCHTRFSTTGP